jgi:pectate lyase
VNGGGVGNALKVVNSVITNSPGNRGFAQTNAATFMLNAPWVTNAPPYLYTLDAVVNVPSVVTNWAGVNKIDSW